MCAWRGVLTAAPETIASVKAKLQPLLETPPDDMRLVHGERVLENARTIGDYGVKMGDVIALCRRTGGA